ncbi:hypothetical protein BDA96_06G060700 [Sorghum bicolor]|uniref:Uncharacterized protein n=2 Tax=Sorghum bicolor TaxID=4558 RepID=A0A921QQY8_SORBI|nr:hypothetical protein BDA96_06G060700 [Sorghum bicolor]KAG0525486.1 hypothetical protein BDA96_06G060700 [Sorghum bicolor]KAG0525487.1 hypothetical protein BDA96_06G060700 [Sorghum bicolor]KXG26125.1 hypothetical protein SORBI_3006G054000 [Sorghum bicolor]OQU81413.1 hypothetical protein SORBI_3006G054000 [Sorghum bicolor]
MGTASGEQLLVEQRYAVPWSSAARSHGARAANAGEQTPLGPRAEGPLSLRRRSRVLLGPAHNPQLSTRCIAGALPAHHRDVVGGGSGSSPRSPPYSARSRRPLTAREGGTVFTLAPYMAHATEA